MKQSLYRKYRPRTFKDVYDQKYVVKTLLNSIRNGSFSHAYIFSGPRGTGKTSIAKIFAKSANCINPVDGYFCDNCVNCNEFDSNVNIDIIEIDAASNNGVDEIRELKSKINFVPNVLKYKVYIIDEVHMLSISAFNAILKTLEEPPEHVIFILATTEFYKIPSTIVSRCQCFEFKKISIENIEVNLKKISLKENISIDDDVIHEIALYSDGGMRDAIGMLEKVSSYENSNITLKSFYDVNNLVSAKEFKQLLSMLFSNNTKSILEQISSFDLRGVDLVKFIERFILYLRDLVVDYYIKSDDDEFNISFISNLSFLLNDLYYKLRYSVSSRAMIEMFFINFINNSRKNNIIVNSNKNDSIKSTATISNSTVGNVSSKNNLELSCMKNDKIEDNKMLNDTKMIVQNNIDIIINNCFATADRNMLSYYKEKWCKLNDYTFDETFGAISSILSDAEIRVASPSYLLLSLKYISILDSLNVSIDLFSQLLKKIFGNEIHVAFVSEQEWLKLKNEYISKIKNGQNYSLIKIDNLSKKSNVLENNCDKINCTIDENSDFLNSLDTNIVVYE